MRTSKVLVNWISEEFSTIHRSVSSFGTGIWEVYERACQMVCLKIPDFLKHIPRYTFLHSNHLYVVAITMGKALPADPMSIPSISYFWRNKTSDLNNNATRAPDCLQPLVHPK